MSWTLLPEYFQPLQRFLTFLAYPSFLLFLLFFLFVSLYLDAVVLLEALSALLCLLQSLPVARLTLILGEEQNSSNSQSVSSHFLCTSSASNS